MKTKKHNITLDKVTTATAGAAGGAVLASHFGITWQIISATAAFLFILFQSK